MGSEMCIRDRAVAVLSDGRDEPAEAKAGLGGAGVSLEIEQVKGLTLTLALKLIAGNPLLTAQRITDEELSVLLLPEDDRVAVEDAEGRQRQALQQLSSGGLQWRAATLRVDGNISNTPRCRPTVLLPWVVCQCSNRP